MTPVFTARKRAEEFHSLLEGTPGQQPDARYANLLALVGDLRETPRVEARPEFVADLRARLLVEAETALDPQLQVEDRLTVAPRDPAARRRDRRVAAAVAGIALVGSSTGMAVAAQSALPGDTLYPLKRVMEDAKTGITLDDDAKGQALLDNASGRLQEVDALAQRSEDPASIADTLHTFSQQASAASDLLLSDYATNGKETSVERLRDFTADSIDRLGALETVVPESARASLIEAARTLTRIDEAALIACPSCGPDTISELPVISHVSLEDLLGLDDLAPASTTSVPGDEQPARSPERAKDRAPDAPKKQQPPTRTPAEPGTEQPGSPPVVPEVDERGGLLDEITKGLTGGKSDGGDGKDKQKKRDGGLLDDLGTTLGGLGSLLD